LSEAVGTPVKETVLYERNQNDLHVRAVQQIVSVPVQGKEDAQPIEVKHYFVEGHFKGESVHHEPISGYRQTIFAGRAAFKSLHEKHVAPNLEQEKRAQLQSQEDEKAAKKTQREAEKAAKEAEKQAEKNRKQAEREAKREADKAAKEAADKAKAEAAAQAAQGENPAPQDVDSNESVR